MPKVLISMHHLVGTRHKITEENSASRGKDELELELDLKDTPSAFGNGGRRERSITPCTILPCVSLFLFSCQAALRREYSQNLKEIRDAVYAGGHQ